jgi:cyclopropane-fatty-acyl-phospholipid synthase
MTLAPTTPPPAPAAATEPGLQPAAKFLDLLFPAPRAFQVRVGGAIVLAATDDVRFSLDFSSVGAVRRAFKPPVETSLGEAFIDGTISVEGDIVAAVPIVEDCRRAARTPSRIVELARAWRALPRPDGRRGTAGAAPARLSGRVHTPERDHQAIRYHYDMGNDFFALFLDSRMLYTCAYYPTGTEDLDRAQELKLEHVCRKLRLSPGETLLDLGCGWGGLMIHAAKHHGVQAVGVTLSQSQLEWANARIQEAGLEDRVEVRLAHYETLQKGSFDKISSIGMVEHVGIARVPEYFRQVYGLLRPGGLFLNHCVSRKLGTQPNRLKSLLTDPLNRLLVGQSPLTSIVFPDTELVSLSELAVAAERAGWEVRDVESLREHYARTLRHWLARMDENRAEGEALAGAGTLRAWRLYFAVAAYRFDMALINLNQILLAKPDASGRVELPWSRADLYA